jgi:hypothetical protein
MSGFGFISASLRSVDCCPRVDFSRGAVSEDTGFCCFVSDDLGRGGLGSKGFGFSILALGGTGSGRLTSDSFNLASGKTEVDALTVGFVEDGRSGRTTIGSGTGSGDVTIGAATTADLFGSVVMVGLLLSVDDELTFGVLLFGPLALAFVMCVNPADPSIVLSRESCGLLRVCIAVPVLGVPSSDGLGLPLRPSMPTSAGFRRPASLLFSGSFVLKAGSVAGVLSAASLSDFSWLVCVGATEVDFVD